MRYGVAWCGWLLWLSVSSTNVLAQQNASDSMQWLQRIQQAAQRLNYSGTFVYLQHGGQPQTSRTTHIIEGSNHRERIEMLDGAAFVMVRHNDQVKSYFPGTKTVVVEKRAYKGSFPALLTEQISHIGEQYDIRKGETDRVAGIECQTLILEPKDKMRYSHKLWADLGSALLLKAQMINEKGEVVEQIAFSQVEIGGPAERFHARLTKPVGGRDWRTSAPVVSSWRGVDVGWHIENPLPGFRKVLEVRRGIGQVEVGQVVFSDGLASVSVFLEPLRDGVQAHEGASNQGAVNVYRRRIGDQLVTVLGEAPPACVARIAQAIEFRPVPR